ncbi:MAG: class I SAM-dependent RNA methyltransferase [Chloroflexi bacterium]|nr:class I SAM-dependent RNA methyltransferase [Chloroflexota bacterium]
MSRRRYKSRNQKFKGPWITDELGIDRGDRIRVELGDPHETGETSATYEGISIEVAGGVPGETVEVEITRRYPNSLAATVVGIDNPSTDRTDPLCPYYLSCSGCQWQHVTYERQLDLKRERVERAIRAYPEFADVSILPALPSPENYGYRNHARFTVRKSGEIGYVNRHTRQWLRVDRCLLMAEQINTALGKMQDHVRGMSQMSIRVGVNTGDMLIQPKLPNAAIDLKSGGRDYTEKLNGRPYRVAGSSFFQVNTAQAENLGAILAERLQLSDKDTLIDAYAGVGTFAIMLASYVRKVIVIEESNSAVEDATHNAHDIPNIEFIEAKTEEAMPGLSGEVDVLILDPPRRGCHPEAIEATKQLAPGKIAMVSCDPQTMARDLASLCADSSFILEEVQPVDLFPQTHHVECIAILKKA